MPLAMSGVSVEVGGRGVVNLRDDGGHLSDDDFSGT